MEVHDCFSITELVTYEDLGISPRGRAKEDIDAGFFELGGQIPCQPDGGLKCFGHPIGASGLADDVRDVQATSGQSGPQTGQESQVRSHSQSGGGPGQKRGQHQHSRPLDE